MRLEYFQMVDRVTGLDVGSRRIETAGQVPDHSPVFEGHFPGHPILPGVLMIETMAQTGGWLILAILRFARMPFLMQVEKAKMRAFVTPGQMLVSQAELLHDGSGYAVVKASIAVRRADGRGERPGAGGDSAAGNPGGTGLSGQIGSGDKKVAEAEIRYGVVAFPNDSLRPVMLQTARRIGMPERFLDAE